jgi:hypothetical protein
MPTYLNHKLLLGETTAMQQGTDTVDFVGTDKAELFQENLLKKPQDWWYRTKPITYKLNSNGYRAPDWETINWSHAIVILGCSMTFGIGLAEDETISWYLSEILGRPVINLGVGGSSIPFSCYNSSLIYRNFGMPWAVINLWTDLNRVPIFSEVGINHNGPWCMTRESLMDHWTRSPFNAITHARMMSGLVHDFWKDKTRYWEATFFDHTAEYLEIERIRFEDRARDDLHIGKSGALQTAQKIAKKLG